MRDARVLAKIPGNGMLAGKTAGRIAGAECGGFCAIMGYWALNSITPAAAPMFFKRIVAEVG